MEYDLLTVKNESISNKFQSLILIIHFQKLNLKNICYKKNLLQKINTV